MENYNNRAIRASAAPHLADPLEGKTDNSASTPDSIRHHVSTPATRIRGKIENTWRGPGRPPDYDPREDRCNRCPACKNAAKLSCVNQRDPNLCLGCSSQSLCWGTRPCELWSILEEARHHTRFSIQAYDNPSVSNRVDLITRTPYRFDLGTKTTIRLPYHPITQVNLGPPPETLRGAWDAGKEYTMVRRMLGQLRGTRSQVPLAIAPPQGTNPPERKTKPFWSETPEQKLLLLLQP